MTFNMAKSAFVHCFTPKFVKSFTNMTKKKFLFSVFVELFERVLGYSVKNWSVIDGVI